MWAANSPHGAAFASCRRPRPRVDPPPLRWRLNDQLTTDESTLRARVGTPNGQLTTRESTSSTSRAPQRPTRRRRVDPPQANWQPSSRLTTSRTRKLAGASTGVSPPHRRVGSSTVNSPPLSRPFPHDMSAQGSTRHHRVGPSHTTCQPNGQLATIEAALPHHMAAQRPTHHRQVGPSHATWHSNGELASGRVVVPAARWQLDGQLTTARVVPSDTTWQSSGQLANRACWRRPIAGPGPVCRPFACE